MPIYIPEKIYKEFLFKGKRIKVSTMQINISHTNSFQFENRENLKNYAKNILTRQGASQETSQRLVDQTIFTRQEANYAPHLAIIKASSQISLNNNLKDENYSQKLVDTIIELITKVLEKKKQNR